MELATFISHYGYLAIAIATPFEGELALVLGGIAVHAGYLNSMTIVIMAAFIGALSSDMLFFLLGHYKGHAIIKRFPRVKRWLVMPTRLIHKRPILIMFGMRFLYGIRNIVPFAIGMTRVKVKTFLIINVISAIVWSSVLCWLGYFFGSGLSIFFHKIKNYEFKIIFYVAIAFMIGHLINELIQFLAIKMSFSDADECDKEAGEK
ncbi:MAG: DedA family protein [Candidatus Paceibacterota bacterium]|jgi:membrane protein DedA with SNARE-associated domain